MSKVYQLLGAGWIKEANKLGRFSRTYKGFRIYITKEGSMKEAEFERDGEMWRRTDIEPPLFAAMDKYGVLYQGRYESVIWEIDVDVFQQSYNKKHNT